MEGVLGLILGGGRGLRLWPLTKLRAKPAVPIGGKYRLVDIPISNCLHSGIHEIAILTQFNSVSLHRHIARTYHFDYFHPGWVQILAAVQTFTSADWYQGTADAVRKQLYEIQVTMAKDILILAGDHLYRMDYRPMIEFHQAKNADVTISVKPVSGADASRFGILKRDKSGRITSFIEKPQDQQSLKGFQWGDDPRSPYLCSMGNYIFRLEALLDLLDSEHVDFGGDVIPAAIQSHRVFGYPFEGYWEDIGTVRAFFDANLALTRPDPDFRFHDLRRPIFTRPRFLPGSRIYDVILDQVLLADGCIVEGSEIRRSVIGIRSVIGEDAVITDTVMMGADYYEDEARDQPPGVPVMGIGEGSSIQGALIDKNARIGSYVTIHSFPRGTDRDEENWVIRDGIVVVPKAAIIPDDTVIAPERD